MTEIPGRLDIAWLNGTDIVLVAGEFDLRNAHNLRDCLASLDVAVR